MVVDVEIAAPELTQEEPELLDRAITVVPVRTLGLLTVVVAAAVVTVQPVAMVPTLLVALVVLACQVQLVVQRLLTQPVGLALGVQPEQMGQQILELGAGVTRALVVRVLSLFAIASRSVNG